MCLGYKTGLISSHLSQVVMLTGDNPLTACHVAKELKITTRKILVLTPTQDGWAWQSVGGNRTVSMDTQPAELGSTYDLCLAGEVSYCQVNNEKVL